MGFGLLALTGVLHAPTEFLPLAQWSDRYWPMLVVGLIGLYLVRPFFLWPLSIFPVFIGYAFGFPVKVPLALLGTLLTCAPPFLIATRFNEEIPYFGRIVEHRTTLVETTGELRGRVAARLSPAPADTVEPAQTRIHTERDPFKNPLPSRRPT